jgi:hypothetical protein
MSEDVVTTGLRAYRRRQQRLTDARDRAALHDAILAAGPDGLVLDAKYGIRIGVYHNAPKGWGQYEDDHE